MSEHKLADNIITFVRTLRAAGLPVGTQQIIDGLKAVDTIGLESREDLYWALHGTIVRRRDHRPLFDQAFNVFWQNPRLLESVQGIDLAELLDGQADLDGFADKADAGTRRVQDALGQTKQLPLMQKEQVLDAGSFSAREVLQTKDFEQMSDAELKEAVREVQKVRMIFPDIRSRRLQMSEYGPRIDRRRTFRNAVRPGGEVLPFERLRPRKVSPPIVALCDISGSMSAYTRVLLVFLHALAKDQHRVHSFLFGTRLSNITRQLRNKDVDEALALIGEHVNDWSGGTRIGKTIDQFNRDWSRRVLGQGATVLFISDGIDRDSGEGLSQQMERLAKSCRRLIWLNPLLRYEEFEPKAAGIKAILPHVDEFRTIHNLNSIADLATALTREPGMNVSVDRL